MMSVVGRMSRSRSLLIGLLFCWLLFAVIAPTPVQAVQHDEESYWDAITHKLSSLWPFSSKLGDDWEETQQRVEEIYGRTHNEAKQRVEELKEDVIREADLQKQVADIYKEAALKAEREIESLKHPLTEKLTSWIHIRGREPTHEEKRTLLEKMGWSSRKPPSEELTPRHLYEDTTKKIGEAYREALEQAKSKLGDVSGKLGDIPSTMGDVGSAAGSAARQGWHATKTKAAQAYSEAFHKGHGEARSRFQQFRDMMGRGLRSIGSGTMSAARKTVELVWSLMTSAVMAVLGGVATLYALRWWNKRQLFKQLHANVAGPVIACGEYYVVGNEAEQKKFYDFWSSTGYSFFSRQPGLRKYWMHRGVPGGENNWMSYSEWASIDDLRRASVSSEFCEIKKRSPGHAAKQIHIYQLASTGGAARVEGEGNIGKESSGLRQRSSTTTTTTSSST